jgi:hypothetical protein
MTDMSNYTIQQCLIVNVWVLDREEGRKDYEDFSAKLLQRLNKPAPSRETSRTWENKAFSTGSVPFTKRSYRPESRRDHVDTVEASCSSSSQKAMRKRSLQSDIPPSNTTKK